MRIIFDIMANGQHKSRAVHVQSSSEDNENLISDINVELLVIASFHPRIKRSLRENYHKFHGQKKGTKKKRQKSGK